jgi:bifunctional non-homologous end joining protein LigD
VGIHVHVPLGRPHDGDEAKAFARAVAGLLAQAHPDEAVRGDAEVEAPWQGLRRLAPERPLAADGRPYSLRGLPWPTVAAPVTWGEVEQAVEDQCAEELTFVAQDLPLRVRELGDLFAPMLTLEQALPE